jgi:hypothetical protein
VIARRRLLLTALAAPAVVRTPGLLMPVRPPLLTDAGVVWPDPSRVDRLIVFMRGEIVEAFGVPARLLWPEEA